MGSVTEASTADNVQSTLSNVLRGDDSPRQSPRRQKGALLPEVTRLALEGHSGQAIARMVGLPKRTVNHWLQDLRQEWIAKATEGVGEMFAVELARLDSIYREAMEAWRNSQADLEVRLVEQIEVTGGKPRSKRSVRTQAQRGNAALLTRAMAAVMASCRLKGRVAPSPAAADRDEGPIAAESTPGDVLSGIPKLGTIEADRWWLDVSAESVPDMPLDELEEAASRLGNVIKAEGGVLPAELENRDLLRMTADEIRAFRAWLTEAINKVFDTDEDTPPSAEGASPHPPSNLGG